MYKTLFRRGFTVTNAVVLLVAMLTIIANTFAPLFPQRYGRIPADVQRCANTVYESSVVVYTPDGAMGSAIAVAPHYLLTAYHVIDGQALENGTGKQVELILRNPGNRQEVAYATIEKIWPGNDLALLRTTMTFSQPVTIADLLPKNGAGVLALGTPLTITNYNTVSYGVQGGIYKVPSRPALPLREMYLKIDHGNSGGGVFDTDCKLVGITSMLTSGIFYEYGLYAPVVSIKKEITEGVK
jgi:S1-C subfamily serine protease